MALTVACAMFMENLDSTVIATSLPQISRSFGTNPVNLSLGITSYLVSLAIFIPISGWIADRFGSRNTFRTAIVIFTLGSIVCGLCDNLVEFVFARLLQGFGGAMMIPVGRLVLVRAVDKSQLVGAFAYVTIPATFAPLVGAPLGGLITTYFGWRWIFYINLPIGLIGMLMASICIPDIDDREVRPLDWSGFLLMASAVSCIVFGLEAAARGDIDYREDLALLAMGAVFSVLAFRQANRSRHPLLDLSLCRIPTYAASVLGGAFYRVACGAFPFVLPLTLQLGLGKTAFAAGLLTFCGAVGGVTMKPAATAILRRFGFRTVLLVSGTISAISMLLCLFIARGLSLWLVVPLLLAGGFLRSLHFTSLMAVAWADIPAARASAATSLFGLFQQVSFSGGVAFGALLLHAAGLLHPGSAALAPADFSLAFIGIGGLALINVASYIRLPSEAGAEISGHARRRPVGRPALLPGTANSHEPGI